MSNDNTESGDSGASVGSDVMNLLQAQSGQLDQMQGQMDGLAAGTEAGADSDQAREGVVDSAALERTKHNQPWYVIEFPVIEGPLGDRRVEVGVQGYSWQMARGTPHAVPQMVVSVLNDAVQTHYKTVVDKETKTAYQKPMNRTAYPYQQHGGKFKNADTARDAVAKLLKARD